MSFPQAVTAGFTQWNNWKGRASRSEYWWFQLFYLLALFAAGIVGAIVHFPALLYVAVLALIVPTIGVGVRRLHDTGKSGAYYLLGLIPFVGGIILLIFFVTEGQPGDNRYGPAIAAGSRYR